MARATTNGSQSSASYEDLEKQIAVLKKDIAKLTETVGEYGRARSNDLRGAAYEQAAHLRAQGEKAVSAAQAKLDEQYRATEAKVRENPAAAVGIAAGIGFIVGLLTSSRR